MSVHLYRIIVAISLLTSCSILPGTQAEIQQNATIYVGSGFTIQVPTLWQTYSGNSLPTSPAGVVVLSLLSPDVRYGFSNNLIVMREHIDSIVTSIRYADISHIQSSKKYLEYKKIQEDPIIFADSDVSRITVFEAKYNTTTPKLKFIQTAKVCGSNIYMIHFSIALDKIHDPYIALAKTFTCD